MSENIVRFEQMAQQTVGDTTKIIGLVKTKDIASIIDSLDLEANPRSSKTNAVTDGIQNSLESDPDLFPFKTKGILLASSEYTMLDRGRIIIRPQDRSVEGILDGGHNTLAIGLYMLKQALEFGGRSLDSKVRKWDEFKEAWTENRDLVSLYFDHVRNNPGPADKLDTLVPVELLVPRDQADSACVEKFRSCLSPPRITKAACSTACDRRWKPRTPSWSDASSGSPMRAPARSRCSISLPLPGSPSPWCKMCTTRAAANCSPRLPRSSIAPRERASLSTINS